MGQKQSITKGYSPTFSQNRHSISVLSYNVLAESYCDQNIFPYASENVLRFSNRLEQILNIIIQHDPDILCLQEVDNFDQYHKRFMDEFESYCLLHLQRPGRADGCVIAYKKDVFECTEYFTQSLDDLATLAKLPNQYNRQNVFQIANLVHLNSKALITVGNIHTFWNPQAEEVKYFQVATYIKEVEKAAHKDASIIVCGDLNSTPNSNMIKYILDGTPPNQDRLDYPQKYSQLQQHYNIIGAPTKQWKSAYDPLPQYTNYTQKFKGCLDYIFYHKLNVAKTLDIPPEEYLSQEVALPNTLFPSDHEQIKSIEEQLKETENELKVADIKQSLYLIWIGAHYRFTNSDNQKFMGVRNHIGSYLAYGMAAHNCYHMRQQIIKQSIYMTKSKNPMIVKAAMVPTTLFYFGILTALWHIPSLSAEVSWRLFATTQSLVFQLYFTPDKVFDQVNARQIIYQ